MILMAASRLRAETLQPELIGLASPTAVWPECLDRSHLQSDLAAAGAEPYELELAATLEAVHGRTAVDFVRVSQREVAFGFAHFTAGRDRLRLGISFPEDQCGLEPYFATLAVLYSDAGPALQLAALRRLTGTSVELARDYGWAEDGLGLVAGVALSSPALARRLVRQCRGDRECLAEQWIELRPDRRERAEALL